MLEPLAILKPDVDTSIAERRLRLRVPRKDRSLYAVPELPHGPELARGNAELLQESTVDIQGRSLTELRSSAREELLQAAVKYTQSWTADASYTDNFQTLYVTGHQPQLYHPGVWVKNSAINRFANGPGAIGVNLVVDNDTYSTAGLKVPAGDRAQPQFHTIPFDATRPTQPWEGVEIQDTSLFESFGERVSEHMGSWGIQPLIEELWPLVLKHAKKTLRLADCFTAARNQLERSWGLTNLELPLSQLCSHDSFFWFVSHLLAHLPRFREEYNRALAEYREVNKVRSHTHPVPELRQTGDWLEAPFWIWRDGAHQRQRLFAQQSGNTITLRAEETEIARLPLTSNADAAGAVDALQGLSRQGWRLRTRALTTTLFARLFFADLFIHGIGGAKYDEMTNRLLDRFYGITPPEFMAVSATVLLPLDPYPVALADASRATAMLRDLRFNAEKYFDANQQAKFAGELLEKQNLLTEAEQEKERKLPRAERRQGRYERTARARRLQAIRDEFAAELSDQTERISTELDQIERRLTANKVLASREYSFALYPEDTLRPFLSRLES